MMNKKGLAIGPVVVLLVGFVAMVWGIGDGMFKLNERGKSLNIF